MVRKNVYPSEQEESSIEEYIERNELDKSFSRFVIDCAMDVVNGEEQTGAGASEEFIDTRIDEVKELIKDEGVAVPNEGNSTPTQADTSTPQQDYPRLDYGHGECINPDSRDWADAPDRHSVRLPIVEGWLNHFDENDSSPESDELVDIVGAEFDVTEDTAETYVDKLLTNTDSGWAFHPYDDPELAGFDALRKYFEDERGMSYGEFSSKHQSTSWMSSVRRLTMVEEYRNDHQVVSSTMYPISCGVVLGNLQDSESVLRRKSAPQERKDFPRWLANEIVDACQREAGKEPSAHTDWLEDDTEDASDESEADDDAEEEAETDTTPDDTYYNTDGEEGFRMLWEYSSHDDLTYEMAVDALPEISRELDAPEEYDSDTGNLSGIMNALKWHYRLDEDDEDEADETEDAEAVEAEA